MCLHTAEFTELFTVSRISVVDDLSGDFRMSDTFCTLFSQHSSGSRKLQSDWLFVLL